MLGSAAGVSQKRKRSDVDENDPKLQEFLEVMQPASKSRIWTSTGQEAGIVEPPTKMQAIELPEAESDEEYEVVPKRSTREQKSPVPAETPTAVTATPADVDLVMENAPQELDTIQTVQPVALDATDDDWLRSRTNRLLDLVDSNDVPNVESAATAVTHTADHSKDHITSTAPSLPLEVPAEIPADPPIGESSAMDKILDTTEATIEAIKKNGRLFARNLPYTATEEDLRDHFAVYGVLEEVRNISFSFSFVSLRFHDEYPDRDSLCLRAYDENWTKILVDASCVLKTIFLQEQYCMISDENVPLTCSTGPLAPRFSRREQRVCISPV